MYHTVVSTWIGVLDKKPRGLALLLDKLEDNDRIKLDDREI